MWGLFSLNQSSLIDFLLIRVIPKLYLRYYFLLDYLEASCTLDFEKRKLEIQAERNKELEDRKKAKEADKVQKALASAERAEQIKKETADLLKLEEEAKSLKIQAEQTRKEELKKRKLLQQVNWTKACHSTN